MTTLEKELKKVTEMIVFVDEIKEGTQMTINFLHGEEYTEITFLVIFSPRMSSDFCFSLPFLNHMYLVFIY